MTFSKELVGPLRFVHFGPIHDPHNRIPYTPPRDTLDLRAAFCLEHRVGCDCREAELAEHWREAVAELRAWDKAARTVLAGHRTFDWDDPGTWRGDGPRACQCHGCQLVRAARPPVHAVGGSYDTGIIQSSATTMGGAT